MKKPSLNFFSKHRTKLNVLAGLVKLAVNRRKIICLISLLSCLTISACLPAAFLAGATAGGVVIADRRTFETMVRDKEITCKVLLQLNSDPQLKEQSVIGVVTFNRVVLLVGQVETPELRVRAYELVKVVPHIRRINNAIEVAAPIFANEISRDTWITTKVKGALLAEKGLNSTQIKVVTERGVVYLMGLVTHSQAETAINVVRQVTGVNKVVTLFEYIA
jgi:osmotically-inducible protein OsmY